MVDKTSGLLDSLDRSKGSDAGTTTREYVNKETIYFQGDASDVMFFIRSGNVKLTARSSRGKKAIIAILHRGDFFGEGCLARKSLRLSTATAVEASTIARVTKATMARKIHREPDFAKALVSQLVLRIGRIEQSFVDQIFSSSERRLARILWVMAEVGQRSQPEPVLLKVSQETLAEMVGTTRSRVSHFMNRFRDLGFIDYNGSLHVHPSLLTFLKS